MNRASKGCEALIRYNAQEQARFKVFDWSLDHLPSKSRWTFDRPLSELSQYIKATIIAGQATATLPIRNLTFCSGGYSWTNQVLLLNQVSSSWDVVHHSVYSSTPAILQSSEIGTWSPILETFQNPYAGTEAFGSWNTQLRSCSSGGVWSAWAPLSAQQSGFWAEGLGFYPVVRQPNYSWAVKS